MVVDNARVVMILGSSVPRLISEDGPAWAELPTNSNAAKYSEVEYYSVMELVQYSLQDNFSPRPNIRSGYLTLFDVVKLITCNRLNSYRVIARQIYESGLDKVSAVKISAIVPPNWRTIMHLSLLRIYAAYESRIEPNAVIIY